MASRRRHRQELASIAVAAAAAAAAAASTSTTGLTSAPGYFITPEIIGSGNSSVEQDDGVTRVQERTVYNSKKSFKEANTSHQDKIDGSFTANPFSSHDDRVSNSKRSSELDKEEADDSPRELHKAMKLLTSMLPSMFKDLCPPCYSILSTRLSGISSGLELAANINGNYASYESSGGNCRHNTCPEATGAEHPPLKALKNSGSSLTPQERERIRFLQVSRKTDFKCIERIHGKPVNIVEGLELHTNVFSAAEQSRLVALVYDYQKKGQDDQLKERTYAAPPKWMAGKGRVTLQFGCCYNYAADKNGNPPGILRDEAVDPIPSLLNSTIKRLVRWHVLPPDCIPDSCIINIYEEGDCIPPHIDHHDFLRPFCTLSLLSECNIIFGSSLRVLGPGQFEGSLSIPLPVGSVLVLKGNGADVAKHSVPAVPTKRLSITFRKMDPRKAPLGFKRDPSMQSILPLSPDGTES